MCSDALLLPVERNRSGLHSLGFSLPKTTSSGLKKVAVSHHSPSDPRQSFYRHAVVIIVSEAPFFFKTNLPQQAPQILKTTPKKGKMVRCLSPAD